MKKNIFVILISTLFILVLFYLYDESEKILNQEYYDYKKNIFIHYPYFNNVIIDNYMNDYLEAFINQGSDWGDLLFIDYDYESLGDKIELLLYIYSEKGSVVRKETRQLEFDIGNGLILGDSRVMDTSVEFYDYQERLIYEDKPMIALTFDDGPNHNTSRILDVLEKYGVRATFFVLGCNIKNNENIIMRMNNLGMEIGNHMYSHKLLTKLDDNEIKEEISNVDNLVFDIINEYPTLVRPSYGTFNKRIKKIINRPIVLWNIDTLDWKNHNSKQISSKIIKNVDDGDIILMHDIYRATANSLEIVIPKLLDEGYQLVTVSELLYYKGINIKNGEVYSNVR